MSVTQGRARKGHSRSVGGHSSRRLNSEVRAINQAILAGQGWRVVLQVRGFGSCSWFPGGGSFRSLRPNKKTLPLTERVKANPLCRNHAIAFRYPWSSPSTHRHARRSRCSRLHWNGRTVFGQRCRRTPRRLAPALNFAVFSFDEYRFCTASSTAALEASEEVQGWIPESPTAWSDYSDYSPEKIVPLTTAANAATTAPLVPECPIEQRAACSLEALSHLEITIYSMPPVLNSHGPKGVCQESQMRKAAAVIQETFFVNPTYSCIANSWSYTGGADPRGQADVYFRDSLNLDGQWIYAMAWIRSYGNNGVASGDDVALGAELCVPNPCVDWGHAQIAQHELSHLFGANDKGRWCNQGYGIMNECHANQEHINYDKDSATRICDHFDSCTVDADIIS